MRYQIILLVLGLVAVSRGQGPPPAIRPPECILDIEDLERVAYELGQCGDLIQDDDMIPSCPEYCENSFITVRI